MTNFQRIEIQGIEAEQIVSGVLRGGFVLCGEFHFHAGTEHRVVPAGDYRTTQPSAEHEITGALA